MSSRVLVVRGHQATPWDLRQWEALSDRYDVGYLRTAANGWDIGAVALDAVPVRTRRDRLPKGMVGDVAAALAGDRYGSGADEAYAAADVVHAEELTYWFAADAARAKRRHGFKLVQTVWETLPMLRAFRRRGLERFRDDVLAETDLFLPSTERARIGLLLEGVPEEKIVVCPPGIDIARFGDAAGAGQDAAAGGEHLLVSPGRLVWEKGHHDTIRALALLHRGIVRTPAGATVKPRLQIVGRGPEEARLRAHAAELGVGDHVSFGAVPYDDMPGVFARASALVLGSQSSALGGRHPLDVPRAFWEEQFGFVFVEAMAAGLAIVTTSNGAIPEVLDGNGQLVPAGDYIGIARALAAGPLSHPPGTRVAYPPQLLQRYSLPAMGERLAAAYDRVLAG